MTSTPILQENNFKRYIRNTLYAAIGRPPAPNLHLRGQFAISHFVLPPHIEEQFGWKIETATILVRRDADRKITGHGWYCVGQAINEDLKDALKKAQLGNTFYMTWGSDRRIYSWRHDGPAVDVLNTRFYCEFRASWSAMPDWQGLDEDMKQLLVVAALRDTM